MGRLIANNRVSTVPAASFCGQGGDASGLGVSLHGDQDGG